MVSERSIEYDGGFEERVLIADQCARASSQLCDAAGVFELIGLDPIGRSYGLTAEHNFTSTALRHYAYVITPSRVDGSLEETHAAILSGYVDQVADGLFEDEQINCEARKRLESKLAGEANRLQGSGRIDEADWLRAATDELVEDAATVVTKKVMHQKPTVDDIENPGFTSTALSVCGDISELSTYFMSDVRALQKVQQTSPREPLIKSTRKLARHQTIQTEHEAKERTAQLAVESSAKNLVGKLGHIFAGIEDGETLVRMIARQNSMVLCQQIRNQFAAELRRAVAQQYAEIEQQLKAQKDYAVRIQKTSPRVAETTDTQEPVARADMMSGTADTKVDCDEVWVTAAAVRTIGRRRIDVAQDRLDSWRAIEHDYDLGELLRIELGLYGPNFAEAYYSVLERLCSRNHLSTTHDAIRQIAELYPLSVVPDILLGYIQPLSHSRSDVIIDIEADSVRYRKRIEQLEQSIEGVPLVEYCDRISAELLSSKLDARAISQMLAGLTRGEFLDWNDVVVGKTLQMVATKMRQKHIVRQAQWHDVSRASYGLMTLASVDYDCVAEVVEAVEQWAQRANQRTAPTDLNADILLQGLFDFRDNASAGSVISAVFDACDSLLVNDTSLEQNQFDRLCRAYALYGMVDRFKSSAMQSGITPELYYQKPNSAVHKHEKRLHEAFRQRTIDGHTDVSCVPPMVLLGYDMDLILLRERDALLCNLEIDGGGHEKRRKVLFDRRRDQIISDYFEQTGSQVPILRIKTDEIWWTNLPSTVGDIAIMIESL